MFAVVAFALLLLVLCAVAIGAGVLVFPVVVAGAVDGATPVDFARGPVVFIVDMTSRRVSFASGWDPFSSFIPSYLGAWTVVKVAE